MASVEISTIQNEAILKVASKADRKGNNDGRLDANELGLFTDYSIKKKVLPQEIREVLENFKAEDFEPETIDKLTELHKKAQGNLDLLTEIDNLEKELDSKRIALNQAQSEILKPSKLGTAQTKSEKLGILGGAITGMLLGSKSLSVLDNSVFNIGKTASKVVRGASLFVPIGVAFATILAGRYIGSKFNTDSDNEYKEHDMRIINEKVKPLKLEIDNLQEQIDSKTDEFYAET